MDLLFEHIIEKKPYSVLILLVFRFQQYIYVNKINPHGTCEKNI